MYGPSFLPHRQLTGTRRVRGLPYSLNHIPWATFPYEAVYGRPHASWVLTEGVQVGIWSWDLMVMVPKSSPPLAPPPPLPPPHLPFPSCVPINLQELSFEVLLFLTYDHWIENLCKDSRLPMKQAPAPYMLCQIIRFWTNGGNTHL